MTEGAIKTLLVTDSLHPVGGVERSFARLLHHFDRSLVEPKMVVLGRPHSLEPGLPHDVPVKYLGCCHARRAVLPLTRIIGADNPQIIHSAKTHVNVVTVAANVLAGRPSCAIPSERVHLPAHVKNQTLSRRWKWHATLFLAGLMYRRAADEVVFVSQGALEGGRGRLRLPENMATVIYNPVVDDALLEASQEPVDHPWFTEARERPTILGVGRLTKQKGFSYLLRAFRRVRSSLPARLVLVGDGEDCKLLNSLARGLDIEGDVSFVGFQHNPYRFMAAADVFVLPSLWEGFGLVLVEAMACGAPVIGTSCPSGPEEIVSDGVNGLLVRPGDVDALSNAILKVLTNPPLARRLAAAGRRRAEDFRVEKSVRQYEQLFHAVVARRRAQTSGRVPNRG